MKKILGFMLLVLILCSPVYASEVVAEKDSTEYRELVQALYECDLDSSRWEPVSTIGNDLNRIVLFDKNTVTSPYSDEIEVWQCTFVRGKNSCGIPSCVEKKIDLSKHYHFDRWRYNLRTLKTTLLSSITRNSQFEIIDIFEYPVIYQTTFTINPGSIAEVILNRAKEVLDKKKK